MGLFKTKISLITIFLSTSAFGIQSNDFAAPKVLTKQVVTRVEANAIQSLQVKRLKRMLDQKRIDTEQFFSKIEKLVK